MRRSWPEGLRLSLPVVVPTAALGASYGLLAAPVVGALPAVAMSALVWSGAAQFAVLGALTGGAGVLLAASTGLLANGRFLPMGFAIAPSLHGGPLRRAGIGATLVDASFALAHRGGGRFDPGVILWAAPTQYLAWVLGTAAGAGGAGVIGDPERFGLDVLFPVFFLALVLPELWPARFGDGHAPPGAAARESAGPERPTATPPPDRRPLIVAALAVVITLALTPFAPAGVPVLAAAAAALVGLREPRGEEAA